MKVKGREEKIRGETERLNIQVSRFKKKNSDEK